MTLVLNACFVASRVLIEAALCECPLSADRNFGRLDLSRAMAQVMMIHHLGGWSDAMRWGAVEPRLRITPLGDIHLNHRFIDEVYVPFAKSGGRIRVEADRDAYPKLYAEEEQPVAPHTVFEARFLEAWKAEFGVPLEAMLTFLEKLEDIHVNPLKSVCSQRQSVLVRLLADAALVSEALAAETLSLLTLGPRAGWRDVPPPFSTKDWHPWRFRRRLSVLRRPFNQVEEGTDPGIVFAPGIVRDSLQSTLRWFHTGEIAPQQARSVEMSRWIGYANNVQRTAFNATVSDRMRELGWRTEKEIKLTRLLNRSFERDYGDVDVLAWNSDSGRVLIMECKDLHYHKTMGEVAEQLSDFRGEIRTDGKPDHLRRHLDRLEVVRMYGERLARFLKLRSPAAIEGYVVFKNPVPMVFAWESIASKTGILLLPELDKL